MTTYTLTYDDGLYFSNVRLSAAERDAGLAAARAIFEAHGVPAALCYRAVRQWADGGPHDPVLCHLWQTAETAAIATATHGWATVPDGVILECDSIDTDA